MRAEKLRQQKVVNISAAAKAHWCRDFAESIHDMPMDPKKAWECIKLLCRGKRLHHTEKKQTMSMKMENGELLSSDEEHIRVFGPHFNQVLNNKKDIDFTVLEHIEPRETMFELDEPLTRDEFEQVVNKLKAGKASGLNGVPPEAFKAMDEELRTLVFGYCVRYWEGEDFRGWQMSQCVPVPKSGDLSNPNKWRGVILMGVMSKIFISSILNGRIFNMKIIQKHGNRFQFGGTPKVGCADGLFTIKTLLNMRRNNDQDTYVAFVDLVKAFDTADHQLLIKILEKYGAPFNLASKARRQYGPVLFLFRMNAFAESLEKIWESKGLEKVQVVRASDEDFENGIGIVRGHTPIQFESSKLDILSIFQTVNGEETASKTECVFFPRPSFLSKKKNAPALANEPFDGSIVQSVPVAENAPVEIHEPSWRERREASAERAKKKAELEKTPYFSIDQTQPIAVKDGFVTVTMHFKYLGSFISYNLRDDFDIVDLRIKKAGQAMGALKHFFNNKHVDTYTKHLIFKAIPLNLLLWGCETWSLREDHYAGRLQDWIKYAQDASIWKELIPCMLDPQRDLPTRPNWGSRDSSNRCANSQPNSSSQRAKDGSNPAHGGKEKQADDHHPELAESREEEPTSRQWDPEGVGRNLFDSFGVLGLGLDATEMDVKTAYRC
ncbi:hypothetical protein THAOC_32244 [Thalassiosira oceanica]|uniref:Uncharacterized protein n=1 Tax=Thalassiosira oceanica TaxID=159749 RepID=K0RJ05_THAOC|nr:hypothetical protein THAOC_32244 [Thalassiosira oceanica]|eukprot:EJK48921.1 hypothetical protein THAOC_32244 [Thalassiosira oceanica]